METVYFIVRHSDQKGLYSVSPEVWNTQAFIFDSEEEAKKALALLNLAPEQTDVRIASKEIKLIEE